MTGRQPARRGEVWWVELTPGVGHEQHGVRPAVVLSHDRLNASRAELVVIAPMTSRPHACPSFVLVERGDGGLSQAGWVIADAVRSVSSRRLLDRCGMLSAGALRRVEAELLRTLGL